MFTQASIKTAFFQVLKFNKTTFTNTIYPKVENNLWLKSIKLNSKNLFTQISKKNFSQMQTFTPQPTLQQPEFNQQQQYGGYQDNQQQYTGYPDNQ